MLATYLRMSLIGTRRKRQKIFSFLWRTNVEVSSQRKRHQRSVTKTQTPKKLRSQSDLRPLEKKIYIANSSQFLSPDILWSRNVHRQGCRVDQTVSEKLTKCKIAGDTLMTFAGEFFTE